MIFFANLVSFFPIFLFLHCIFIFIFKKWLGPVGTFYASLLIFILSLFFNINELYFILLNGNYFFVDLGRWFFCLDLIDSHLVFCVDTLALTCSTLVLVLTVLALYFGIEYMFREAFINRLLYLLNLFATSVIFLFFCYDFFLIMFAWECIGLFSFLLVNFYSMRIYTIKAALKTFIFSRISDMFMFLSFILSIVFFNTTDLSLIFIQSPFMIFHYINIGNLSLHFLTFFAFTLSTSGVIKAAQFFFHVWLPDAMEAPTPASALIHSSTLVIAGVFLIIRFSIIFEFSILVNYYLALLGAITLAFGSVTAIFQNDIKKLVAYSTISQIGYLVCGCGFCCYEEVLIYLIVHALNKAFLFILVGYVVHFFNGNTDIRQMGGVHLYSFDITVLMLGVCFNLAGLPYSAGFLGKEFLIFQLFRDDFLSLLVRSCWIATFFFTPIYMLFVPILSLYGPKKGVLSGYILFFKFKNFKFNQLSLNYLSFNKFEYLNTNFFKIFNFNYQFTIVTSRTTAYILLLFWSFVFFFGEFLFSLVFNFSTLTDIIPSNFFLSLKKNSIFNLNTANQFLLDTINFYIFFFAISSIFFLLTIKLNFNYKLIDFFFLFDIIFISLIVLIFNKLLFLLFLFLFLLNYFILI